MYNYWLDAAITNYASLDYAGGKILTDGNYLEQEFITKVPEQGILILLGIGLTTVGLAAWHYRLTS